MKFIKKFEWNEIKNQQLQRERNLSFEQIEAAIEQDKLIDIIPHPKEEYKHQQLLVIDIEGYIVLVPYCGK